MNLELRPHPAQARHPITGERLYHDAEKTRPVPLIKDQQAIYLDGKMIGYCGVRPGQPINLTVNVAPSVSEAVRQFVSESVGSPKSVSQPPRPEMVAHAERELNASEYEDDDE